MKKGKFILVIGPTGSGKSSLMKHVINAHPELVLPYSYTTRTRRPDHIENGHYKFLSVEEFKNKVEQGEFLEWAEYGGNYYGTLRTEVEQALTEGKVLLKEVEVQGARQIRTFIPKDELFTIFIGAGSWDALETRVRARAPISEEELALRRKRYSDEMTFMDEADAVVENLDGHQKEANEKFVSLIQSALVNKESL